MFDADRYLELVHALVEVGYPREIAKAIVDVKLATERLEKLLRVEAHD